MNSIALLNCMQCFRLPAVVHPALLSRTVQSYVPLSGRVVAYNPASLRTFAGKVLPDMEGNQKSQQAGAERKAYREDMEESYGEAYSTRSSDEGYGGAYGEAVPKYKTTPDKKKLQPGKTAERDENADALGGTKAGTDYDILQGHPVAEKEKARHAKQEHAFEHASSRTRGETGASM